jgi:hypothetical protein
LALASALAAVVLTVELQHQPTSGVAVRNCLKVLACYAPQQFRVAYGIQPLLDRGIDGRGETVVLLEQEVPTQAAPPKVTDIRQDLARFDGLFGLPTARLQVVNSLARSPSPWGDSDRLQHLRAVLPCNVRVVSDLHPLSGAIVQARGFKHWHAELLLVVVLPDGAPGTVPADATDIFGGRAQTGPTLVLSVEGVRHLRALVASLQPGKRSTSTPKTRK